MSEYSFGCAASMHEGRHDKSMSERGCMKNGMENREARIFSRGGLTTR